MEAEEIVKNIKSKKWDFKEAYKLLQAAEDAYYDAYYELVGDRGTTSSYGKSSYDDFYGCGYGTQTTGVKIMKANESSSEFRDIRKQVEENAEEDEKAYEQIKKKVHKK
jgi:hypothetical protein